MRFVTHEHLDTPHGNTIVWRFMGLDKFLDLLTHRRLFFTNAKNLADHHDVSLPPNLVKSKKKGGESARFIGSGSRRRIAAKNRTGG